MRSSYFGGGAMNDLRYLPLRPRTNRPWLSGWPDVASADPRQWSIWRQEFPGCNWGILTGNGIGVLDIDCKQSEDEPWSFQGFASLIDVEELLGIDLSNLPLVQTASGAHLYFRYDGQLLSKVPWLPHVDVKADGGHQVAAPGTVRDVNGVERTYRLVRGSLGAIPLAPAQLVRAIQGWRVVSSGSATGSHGEYKSLNEISHYLVNGLGRPGERDITCYRLACSLWRKHPTDPPLVEAIIADAWRKTPQGEHQFTWAEAKYKIAQARKFIRKQMEAENAFLRNMGGAR
jgi:hypothetical protein